MQTEADTHNNQIDVVVGDEPSASIESGLRKDPEDFLENQDQEWERNDDEGHIHLK
jgi:hypothetical protein